MVLRINIASDAGLPGRVDEIWIRFANTGFGDDQIPDENGWMLAEVFSGQVVGRRAIRAELGRLVAEQTLRNVAYSRAQACNIMRQGKVLENCEWPANSIAAIRQTSLQEIAESLVRSKPRRNRVQVTDVSGGTNIVGPADKVHR